MHESHIPPTFYKSLGIAIRSRRKAIGQTQEQLANQIGIARATVANIETGRQQILLHVLYQFAAALQLPVEQLLPRLPSPPEIDDTSNNLSLPGDLTREQRQQITRALSDVLNRPSSIPARKESH